MDALHLYHELEQLLRMNSRYCMDDGTLLKNRIVEDALSLNPLLVKLLLGNDKIKAVFFQDVEGVVVFDKVKFQRFVSDTQFLGGSYTMFKNKIGLTDENGRFISESREVVLSWPYKDCVLEGGQTKEEAKRNEIFWNETLAPDEVNRLTEPKVFSHFKRYDNNGEHEVEHLTNADNFIIKGNNLLALHSLKKKYAGKVKLIYIDPPYNTGSDEFGYNDNFNHSSWLTFMKNRLEVAKTLLSDKGCIFVHIDHHELYYIGVLLDSIFGVENKVQVISAKTATPAGFKTVNPGPIDVTEYILFYTKHKNSFTFKKAYVPVDYNKNYNLVLNRNDDVTKWKFTLIKDAMLQSLGFASETEAKSKYGKMWKTLKSQLIAQYAFDHAEDVVSVRDPHKPTDTVKALMKKSKELGHVIEQVREDGTSSYFYNGGALAFYSNKMQIIDGEKCITELLTDFWNHISWAGIANEGGVKLKNGKKPEKLIKQIIEMTTSEKDLVVDFHLGCGTTAAVAHKMNRQYIGIEQLDYGKNDSKIRLKNVIDGDKTGISKAVGWQGGGSFVYCELAKANDRFADEIEQAETSEQLKDIWGRMKATDYLNYKVDIKEVDANAESFDGLSLEDQKRFLIECLDKNLLYVALSDIDSNEYGVTEEDRRLTREFYRKDR
ncbi:MAG: site-specific DNA-methyltransferase [Prevotella sp.]|nr:site-specific DNA-methyltransferase [Prevotella sp.]